MSHPKDQVPNEKFDSKTGFKYDYHLVPRDDQSKEIIVFRAGYDFGHAIRIVGDKIAWEAVPEVRALLPTDVVDSMNEFVKKMLRLKAFL
jgi:hypothetical protein